MDEVHDDACCLLKWGFITTSCLRNLLSFIFAFPVIMLMGLLMFLQTIDTRIKLAYALARQWFGVYISPEAPNDGKHVETFIVMLE